MANPWPWPVGGGAAGQQAQNPRSRFDELAGQIMDNDAYQELQLRRDRMEREWHAQKSQLKEASLGLKPPVVAAQAVQSSPQPDLRLLCKTLY